MIPLLNQADSRRRSGVLLPKVKETSRCRHISQVHLGAIDGSFSWDNHVPLRGAVGILWGRGGCVNWALSVLFIVISAVACFGQTSPASPGMYVENGSTRTKIIGQIAEFQRKR